MGNESNNRNINEILKALAAPFDLREVKWRVTATSKDKSRGLVAAYSDPRTFHRRLNEVLTPAGWSVEYKTETMPGLTRIVKGKTINTGKVITTAILTIFDITMKSSMGEMWADDDNAVTRAEAQAFKRAASLFGIGAYFYKLKNGPCLNLWVPLDEYGVPKQVPRLPDWALLPHDRPNRSGDRPQQQSQSGPQRTAPAQQQQGPPQQQQQRSTTSAPPSGTQKPSPATVAESRKKEHIAVLGAPLYASIANTIEHLAATGQLNGDKFAILENTLKAKEQLLTNVRECAADLPLNVLDGILDRYEVKNLGLIPTYQLLDVIAHDVGVKRPKAA